LFLSVNKTKQNKTKNKKSITPPAAAAAAFTEEHPSPSAFSLLSLHLTAPRKVFFAPVPPRDTTHVREDHARRNSDAVKLRRTTAKKEKTKKKKTTTTTTCRYPRVCSLSRFCPSALTTGLE
jgi:hypothetical protein